MMFKAILPFYSFLLVCIYIVLLLLCGSVIINWIYTIGSSEPEKYEEGRDLPDFIEFLNKRAGTQRGPDGSLLPSAGRIQILDDLVAAAKGTYDESFLTTLLEKGAELAQTSAGEFEKIYAAVAKKILAKGSDYVTQEIQRLEKMVKSPSIAAISKTNFEIKRNILTVFANAK